MSRKLTASLAAVSLALIPVGAQALPERTPAGMAADQEQIVGLLFQYLLLPIIIAAVLAALSLGDDEATPASP